VRNYQQGRAVGRDTVETLLKAAMAAPTAMNRQPWEFVVVDSHDDMCGLMEACPYARMLEQAAVAVVPCVNLREVIEGETRDCGFWIQDVSAATENMLLAAHALGLGAVWTGVYPDSARVSGVQEKLGLPAYVVPLAVVPMGYPEGEQTPKDKWKPAKIHYGSYSID